MRMWWICGAVVALLASATGCGNTAAGGDDAATPVEDAEPAAIDAGTAGVIDAGSVDGGVPDSGLAAVKGDPRQQITSASGRVSGGQYAVDVQFGHATPQARASGATRAVEGTTPIKP